MLRRLMDGLAKGDSLPLSRLADPDVPDDAPVIARFNSDGLREDERSALTAMVAEATDMPVFDGHVKHAYDLALLAEPSRCPRCGSATERQYANFIYATQLAPRVTFAPAGFFCANCPSVVIDQELIEACISDPRFHYKSVLGIDHGTGRDPDLFETWNAENAVYVFDEDQTPLGIGTLRDAVRGSHASAAPARNKQLKRKKAEKASRRARRANRRR